MKTLLVKIYNKIATSLLGRSIRRFFLLRLINSVLVSRLKSSSAVVQGQRMLLDPEDALKLSIRGVYEPVETGIVKKEVKKGDVVLDIGAHIGYYTLLFAGLVGEDGKVFAFEPSPANFSLLEKNVAINGYHNVELVQQAVSDITGKTRLFLSHRTIDNRIYDFHDDLPYIEVKVTCLDDYFRNYPGRIDFIKMDVQGAEGNVIKGMAGLLNKHREAKIIMEFLPIRMKAAGVGPAECLRLLLGAGFSLYEIKEKGNKIQPVSEAELLGEKRERTNLLCLREH